MVKDSSVTSAVNSIEEIVVYDYRKGIVHSSKKIEKSTSLFPNFMVHKYGNFNASSKKSVGKLEIQIKFLTQSK